MWITEPKSLFPVLQMVAVAQSETLRTKTLGSLRPVTMLSLVTQMCRIWQKNAGEDLTHCFFQDWSCTRYWHISQWIETSGHFTHSVLARDFQLNIWQLNTWVGLCGAGGTTAVCQYFQTQALNSSVNRSQGLTDLYVAGNFPVFQRRCDKCSWSVKKKCKWVLCLLGGADSAAFLL